MDSQESHSQIKNMISSLVRGDEESVRDQFHAVLSAKMADRINPSVADQELDSDNGVNVNIDLSDVDQAE